MTDVRHATPLLDREFLLGEGPVWDERRACLFFCDIEAGRVWMYTPGERDAIVVYTGPKVGGFTLETDGRLLLFREDDLATLDPETGALEQLPAADDPARDRFNDVIALPDGSALAGVIAREGFDGALWQRRHDGWSIVDGCESRIGNGLAIDESRGVVYWTDTPRRRIVVLGLTEAGEIAGVQRTIQLDDGHGPGFPDGLTIDSQGTLYSARWAGSSVVALDPTTMQEVRRIQAPTENVTSATFGGPDLATLYITTAGSTLYAAEFGRRGRAEHRTSPGSST